MPTHLPSSISAVVALLLLVSWPQIARAEDASSPPRSAAVEVSPVSVDAGAAFFDAGPVSVDAALAAASTAPAREKKTRGDNTTRTVFAVQIIAGLLFLMALAYLGGHPRLIRLQTRLGISNLAAAGFPFVALGLFASHPRIGVLTGSVLDGLRPLLHFGLGWLGFIIGAQLDIRVLDRVPRGTAYLILVEAAMPFAFTAAACGVLMLAFGMSVRDPALWRNLILLGTAAAMTAPRHFHGFANRSWREGMGVEPLLAHLDEIVGVIGLLFITAYFREANLGTWQLPATAWLFVSIGLGVVIGILIFAMVRVPVSNAEFLAVVLGAVAFAAGLAGYLHLSPIVICFVAGALVVNFPCEQRASIFRILNHLERPVHLLFLMIAGAVWNVGDWRGWALVPLFVIARVTGKWAGILTARTRVGALLPAGFADQRILVSPMSSLAVALVVSMASLYSDPGLPWIVTAVIGAAIVSEVLVQLVSGRGATPFADELMARAPTVPAPRPGLPGDAP
jgi:Kef-type K+ transport system membrane component KefB